MTGITPKYHFKSLRDRVIYSSLVGTLEFSHSLTWHPRGSQWANVKHCQLVAGSRVPPGEEGGSSLDDIEAWH